MTQKEEIEKSEKELQNNRKKLRESALEKELSRLKNVEKDQSRLIFILKAISVLGIIVTICVGGYFMFFTSEPEVKDNDVDLSLQLKTQQLADSVHVLNTMLHAIQAAEIPGESVIDVYVFKVQIGAFKSVSLSDYDDNLVGIKQEKIAGLNMFTLGEFRDYDSARNFLENVREMGFSDSFIVAFYNGERVDINEAIENSKKQK